MPGICVMTVLTLSVSVILCFTTLNHLTRSDRRYYWLILAGLPLSLIVNRLIKIPLINSIIKWADIPSSPISDMPLWFVIVILLSPPVFEEAIKVFPMLIRTLRIFLSSASHALWSGLALGFGFGLGEAIYLAYGIAQSPTYNQLPWHVFTGFLSERLIVTFGHGFMTSIAVLGLYYGKRKAVFGYLSAVGLHTLINLGPILQALKLIPAVVSSMGIYVFILAAFVIFQKYARTLRKTSGTSPVEITYFERL